LKRGIVTRLLRLLSPLFWHVTPRHCVTGGRRFEMVQLFHFNP